MKTPAAVQLLLPEMDGTAGFYEARTDRVLCVRCAGPPAPGAAPIPEANCGDLHSALARRPEGGRRSFRSTTAGRVAAMAPSSILDSVYERAASFGRDVFHYMVTGTMFAVVCSVPWWSDTRWEEVRESSQIVLLFVAATVLFGLGHVLFAIGFWIRNKIIRPDQNWVFRAQMEKYRRAIDRTRQALPGNLVVGDEPAENVHVGLEMSVLLKQPRLHAIFIERYNTLGTFVLVWQPLFSWQVSSTWPSRFTPSSSTWPSPPSARSSSTWLSPSAHSTRRRAVRSRVFQL